MDLARIAAAYYLVFLPSQFICGFAEGAARGDWGLTRADLSYQFGAYVVYIGVWMAVTGLLVVPCILYFGRRLFARLPTRHRYTAFILAAPLTVLVCGVIISVVSRGNVSTAAQVLFGYPWSFAMSSVFFAVLAARSTHHPEALNGAAA